MEGHGWLLEKYGTFGMTFFEFIIGYLCYRESWILKLRKWKDKKSPVVCSVLGIVLIVGMLLFHTLVIRSLFIAPVTGMTIILLFTLWRKPVWVERMFMILGRHSTNIWLIHMFFYLCIFKNLVFKAKYPLLILAFMFGITIVVSTGINFVLGQLKMFIKEIFEAKSPDDFDEETLTTINKFFENSLNVSETSRQLYIHRNTLVYRLDKLQKSTGLDLRVFEDAITFKIALMVVKYMKYMETLEY